MISKPVHGGHYGAVPSLTVLDEAGNLKFSMDFRRVYASLIEDWLGYANSQSLLSDRFETFPLFLDNLIKLSLEPLNQNIVDSITLFTV